MYIPFYLRSSGKGLPFSSTKIIFSQMDVILLKCLNANYINHIIKSHAFSIIHFEAYIHFHTVEEESVG